MSQTYANTYAWMEKLRKGFDPLMITCAVNGGIQGKEVNPALPETPEEIAQACLEVYNAGASIVHLHVRDPQNLADATLDVEACRHVNALVREKCPDLIINNTTGGGFKTTNDDRLKGLAARPELASLNTVPEMTRFTMPPRPAPLTHPHEGYTADSCTNVSYGFLEQLAKGMLDNDIKPELELYHSGSYWVSQNLIDKGLLKPPYLHQFVMGYQTGVHPTPENVLAMTRELPENSIYFVAGIGLYQLPLTTFSMLMGGHVRVGLEDNNFYKRGQKASGNAQLVERVVRIAKELNREIATPAQARTMLGISSEPRLYS
jgi:3-keto-5-aminohexanoate cleavage enzyme